MKVWLPCCKAQALGLKLSERRVPPAPWRERHPPTLAPGREAGEVSPRAQPFQSHQPMLAVGVGLRRGV